jgi:hypothetical protein
VCVANVPQPPRRNHVKKRRGRGSSVIWGRRGELEKSFSQHLEEQQMSLLLVREIHISVVGRWTCSIRRLIGAILKMSLNRNNVIDRKWILEIACID